MRARTRALALLLPVTLGLVALGQVTSRPIDPDRADTRDTVTEPPIRFAQWRQRVWSVFALSSARHSPDNPLGMGWGFQRPDYSPRQFIADHLQPQADMGVERFLLHRPWGDNPGWPMDGDAQAEAMEGRHRQVLGWGPALDDFLQANPRVVVMLYVGSFREPDITALVDAGQVDQAVLRLWLSTTGVMNVERCWLAFDHSATYQGGSWRMAWVSMLRDMYQRSGRRCYLEAWPKVDRPWQHDWDVVCMDRYFRRSRPPGDTWGGNTFADAAHNLPSQDVQGDVLRWDARARHQEADSIARILANGHSVALALHYPLRVDGRTLRDLYTESCGAWPDASP